MSRPLVGLLGLVFASGACYHATVNTGRPLSMETVEKPFASAWILGLVPPSTVDVAAECSNGVARFETQQSFVNGLVGVITLGIYTPMTIKVTCAGSGSAGGSEADVTRIDSSTTLEEKRQAITQAIHQAGLGTAILVSFK